MISGVHMVIYSQNAEADRAFFRDVLEFPAIDAGHGWLIFALPEAEAAFHPADGEGQEMFLMCEDLSAVMTRLKEKKVSLGPVEEARWGSITRVTLPGGGALRLYQPKHPTARSARRR